MIENRFAPKSLIPIEPEPIKLYDSGYTEEQIIDVKHKHAILIKRNLVTEPVTLDEFKFIIIPWQRINRTEVFNLNPEKVKVVKEKKAKEPSTRKPREKKIPGEVKLSKKAIDIKISDIIFKMAVGEPLSEDDTRFFEQHTSKVMI